MFGGRYIVRSIWKTVGLINHLEVDKITIEALLLAAARLDHWALMQGPLI